MAEKLKWEAFSGEYLKAEDVKDNKQEYAVINVETDDDGKLVLILEKDGLTKKFGCNRTNTYAVRQANPESPNDAIGRVVTFNKVQVTNPQTKQIVDGLRIEF